MRILIALRKKVEKPEQYYQYVKYLDPLLNVLGIIEPSSINYDFTTNTIIPDSR
jgi:hypothetical protein